MRILCTFARHQPSVETISNGGRTFSRCTRCGSDLVEMEGAWNPAPKGFRIVWRAPEVAPGAAPPAAVDEGRLPAGAETAASEWPIKPQLIARSGTDRRQSTERKLPAFLGGRDRRMGERRRKSFGKKVAASAPPA